VSGRATSVRVFAPASVGNVGPGFDVLGMAITGLGDTVEAAWARTPGVHIEEIMGDGGALPRDPDLNTAGIAAREALALAGERRGVALRILKGIPGTGLGSSAASAVAGAFAANALLGCPLDAGGLLAAAVEAEAVVAGRHPDNAAPSLLGGAVVVLGLEPLRYARLSVDASLRLVFAIPAYGVETARARAVLPASVPRADAVGQASALAGLVLGLERGDGELLRAAMVDRVAEPARIPLYPGYAPAREAALAAGAFGVAVSGAGPALLAIAPVEAAAAVGRAVVAAYAREGVTAELRVAGVDGEGARVE
jgi:homoserine kinase